MARLDRRYDRGRTPFMLVGIHPPKREIFDISARTNTDPKGIVRAVDVYDRRPWGLYMARPTPGRVQFHYLQSWLLPALGLRANVFHWNRGYERDQDFYLDVGDIEAGGDIWTTEDHYIDLVVYTGKRTELVDVDELLAANRLGLLDAEAAERAIRTAVTAVDGLAEYSYDLHVWLRSNGMDLSWG